MGILNNPVDIGLWKDHWHEARITFIVCDHGLLLVLNNPVLLLYRLVHRAIKTGLVRFLRCIRKLRLRHFRGEVANARTNGCLLYTSRCV